MLPFNFSFSTWLCWINELFLLYLFLWVHNLFIIFPLFSGGDSENFAKLWKVLFFYQHLELFSIYIHSQTNQRTQHAFSFTCPCFILSWNKYFLIANNLCMMLQVYFPPSIVMTDLLTSVAWILHNCVFWSIFFIFLEYIL